MRAPLSRGTLALVTPPAQEPVTLAELKGHARIDVADEDALLTSLITTARGYVEESTGRALLTQTWSLTLDDWPRSAPLHDWWDGVRDGALTSVLAAERVPIPKAPFLAVSTVELLDEDGTPTAVPAGVWYSAPKSGQGELVRRRGQVWPVPLRDAGGIRIRFTAGYGTLPAQVPFAIRQAILLLGAHWYETREPALDRGTSVPFTIAALLAPYRVMR